MSLSTRLISLFTNNLKQFQMKTHKDLDVWKLSIEFVTELYSITASYPKDELYGIVSQIRRSAISVPSNISEGFGRNTTGELNQFLGISKGSLAELETLIEISFNLKYIDGETKERILVTISQLFRMITGLKKSLGK